MTVQARFPKEVRLTRARDFEAIQRSGRRISIPPLRARALRRHASARGSRLGLSIGRQVGGAVERNRWKRAIREAFRQRSHALRDLVQLHLAGHYGNRESEYEDLRKKGAESRRARPRTRIKDKDTKE